MAARPLCCFGTDGRLPSDAARRMAWQTLGQRELLRHSVCSAFVAYCAPVTHDKRMDKNKVYFTFSHHIMFVVDFLYIVYWKICSLKQRETMSLRKD